MTREFPYKNMKTRNLFIAILAGVTLFAACNKKEHFITDKQYRAQVHADYEARKVLAAGRSSQLFGVMDTLDTRDREAMEFLYAYMPYSDLADYDGDFFLKQVRTAFAARDTFSWGRQVPEDVFRHFVLVYRVNNEDLDTARMVFFRELKDRVRNLSMYDAALEVNHWCHEHVAYRAADARTSAPLATMRTSLGRCGEESTFAVTALRAVGIPARQCYTPRWAHCDDNHAWVEVWIDGKWRHLGACEPDPELDMGWFDVPSTRCMMVHSNVFGRYVGNEEVNFQSPLYAKINMLGNYAPTRKVTVVVRDPRTEKPVEGASVMFKLYNYAEYYTLATMKSDAEGRAQLTTGLGDLLIWATDGSRYNYVKLDVREADNVDIYLSREAGAEYVENIDIVPPVPGEAKVVPTQEKVDANAKRLAYEDSLLNAYRATFPKAEDCRDLGGNAGDKFQECVRRSEGNYEVVMAFMTEMCHEESVGAGYAWDYLQSFSDKDMRDIPLDVLKAQFVYDDHGLPRDIFVKGVLPARIGNELVRPWRQFLADELKGLKSAQEVKAWILDNVEVDEEGNYYHCPISPRGVYELKHSDAHSRDIFFVAACRSLYIPAYLDNATNVTYYYDFEKKDWQRISLDDKPAVQPTASITLTYRGKSPAKPVYWPDFTIARYENGDFVSFDFEGDPRMDKFPATIAVEPGYYMLSTGSRYIEGNVQSRVEFFEVREGQHVTKEIVIRPLAAVNPLTTSQQESGAVLNAQMELYDGVTLADYAGGKGVLFVFLGDYREPSKHLVKELQEYRGQLERWGGMTYLVAPASAHPLSWKLPNTDVAMADASAKDMVRDQIISALKLNFNNDYPLVALVDNKGHILFHSEGYSIGLAEQLLKVTSNN